MQTTEQQNSSSFAFTSQSLLSNIFPVIRDKRHSNFSTQNPKNKEQFYKGGEKL